MNARASIRRLWTGLVLLSLATIGVTIALWWTDQMPPIEIVDVKAREGTVIRGGFLTLEYKTLTRRACEGVSQRIIVDSQEVLQLIEPTTVRISEQDVSRKRSRATVIIPVPYGAAVGPARYQAVLSFQCNPLQRLLGKTIEVRTPLVRFDIAPHEAPRFQRLPFAKPTERPPANAQRISAVNPAILPRLSLTRPGASAIPKCDGGVLVRPHYRRVGETVRFIRAYCRRARNEPL